MTAYFERNVGQTDPRVEFLSRGSRCTLFLTAAEAVMALHPGTGAVLRMRLIDARRRPKIRGVGRLAGVSRYYGGAANRGWVGEAGHFAAVRVHGIQPGIDMVYRLADRADLAGESPAGTAAAAGTGLEYDFVVAPGADPGGIELAFAGAEAIEIEAGGDLVLHTAAGPVRHCRPRIYEEAAGVRRELAGHFRRTPRGVGFEVAGRDPGAELVIDPRIVYSTYLGGKPGGGGFTDGGSDGKDFGVDCAVDGEGNLYLTGVVSSPNFPTANPVYSHMDGFSPFITKLDPDGQLVYSTYLPGTHGSLNPRAGFNGGTGIAVDALGNAYVGGITQSLAMPVTPDALQKEFQGALADGFVVQLDPAGRLVYLSYLGGSNFDTVSCVALDAAGSFYVSGGTSSDDFPLANALQAKRGGGMVFGGLDVFVTKFNPGFAGLAWSTLLGGSGDETSSGLAVDAAGNVLVTGWTSSPDYPLANAFQSVNKGGVNRSFGLATDVFVTKLSRDGSRLVYSTYLGGSGPEYPDPDNFTRRIAVDGDGNAYVISDTGSTDFPTTPDALQRTYGGGPSDAFLAKLSPRGELLYSTYLGGSGAERGRSIVLDGDGNVYIAGQTYSADFPTVNPLQERLAGTAAAYLVKLDPTLTKILFATYLGGSGEDGALGLARGPDGDLYLVGAVSSDDFITTPGAVQRDYGGGPQDAFVTRIRHPSTADEE